MSIEITDRHPIDRAEEILTDEALAFLEKLHQNFAGRRDELLAAREGKREAASAAKSLDFLPETADIRTGDWQVAPAPPALQDRRVEMTGPASPAKMAINALNSGAKVWLADLEDASSPTWGNVVDAILNLRDAARGTLAFTQADGREYALRTDIPLAVVVARPRGWHLPEAHVLVDGEPRGSAPWSTSVCTSSTPPSSSIDNGQGPYYYLPKMESHLEARLWNDVFTFAEAELGIPHGTVRATVLIETIPAAFEMEEILYELRDHASGLNAGRWDYLFSIIKYFRDAGPEFVLVDRADITMTAPFMRAYTELLVKTCHKRGAFAMGGMAAFIPSRKDAEINKVAFAKVNADKTREAGDGFDGSWVAHPDLVPVCREVFDGVLGDKPNQIDRQRPEVEVTPAELLDVSSATGGNSEGGLRGQPRGRRRVHGGLAVGQRCGRHPQPDGGRGHRRDLPVPGLAADQERGGAQRHRRDRDQGAGRAGSSTRRSPSCASRCRPSSSSSTTVPAQRADRRPGAVRRLHRLLDPARVRAGQVSVLTASGGPRLDERVLADLDARLADTDAFLDRAYPGEDGRRQPVHTVYVPADRYTVDLPRGGAPRPLDAWPRTAAGPRCAARSVCRPPGRRGRRRGPRPSWPPNRSRTSGSTSRTATAPRPTRSRTPTPWRSPDDWPTPWPPVLRRPFVGLRFKCFEAPTRRRGLRTLDLFLSTLLERTGGFPTVS